MIHSEFNILSDSQTVEIGTRHRQSIHLNRAATREEIHAALASVSGVTPTRPAKTVAAEAREALAAAGLITVHADGLTGDDIAELAGDHER